ncbi:beta-lactamase superfamily domain-containing protein [Microdochium trichocladiopsis]|uniref:Beta-lactamase superfamily domain-containing protein n=1 Tax=Microdochium trichocladiopsis TaxID=1682393 RepID=A0A9P8YI37_9PEZI|nr:beta-lactamase superfamily domain-containing protein [Microdochium trichocladiopsis]KAH7040804.1 beta-lactamase superfamily domain-containing protein [Microdochium trichocladiopsis]
MAVYSSTIAQHTTGGTDSDDAKSHHVKNCFGRTTKFRNPHPSAKEINFTDILSVMTGRLTGKYKWPTPKLEDGLLNVVEPKFLESRTGSTQLRATWLGHACYYVEFPSGLRVLFDPVFEDHCAPVKSQGLKRYTPPPCELSALPHVDAVLISHSHYDHLSYSSVLEVQKHHPNAHFFVGLGLEKWFKASGIENVTELDWWDGVDLKLDPQSPKKNANVEDSHSSDANAEPITARISCLPCQHGSGRGMLDQNTTLWCSWAVSSGGSSDEVPSKSVWFGGDTGYRTVYKMAEGEDDYGPEHQDLPRCPQFKQIGEKFGSFDLGLIPIGAYAPREVFSPVHANPFDAVEIFRDTNCKRAMAIHWGTWVLTPEEPLEPPKLLKEALRRRGIAETGVFDVCDVGESRSF